MKHLFSLIMVTLLGTVLACQSGGTSDNAGKASEKESNAEVSSEKETEKKSIEISGPIKIDGSSTVFPISEAAGFDFQSKYSKSRVSVSYSGTGGGFKKFCISETDISGASRPIKQKEIDKCKANGIDFIEIPVAFDGLTVVAHPENNWAETMTVEQLKTIWEPAAEGKVSNWNQVNPEWPDQELKLFGPGPDSGTFDYFTKAINGEEKASRPDYTPSEDDNVLVVGVSSEKGGLGYFGYAYYLENKAKLKAIGIVDPKTNKAVLPSEETINQGTYAPLSRPIFIYVSTKSMNEKPQVKKFVENYNSNAAKYAKAAGYIPLPQAVYDLNAKRLEKKDAGSRYTGAQEANVDLLKRYEVK